MPGNGPENVFNTLIYRTSVFGDDLTKRIGFMIPTTKLTYFFLCGQWSSLVSLTQNWIVNENHKKTHTPLSCAQKHLCAKSHNHFECIYIFGSRTDSVVSRVHSVGFCGCFAPFGIRTEKYIYRQQITYKQDMCKKVYV